MKKSLIIILSIVFLGYIAIRETSNTNESFCLADKENIIENFQIWLTNGLADKKINLKNNPLEVVDIVAVMEYNSIPEILKMSLYEDFKNSAVCEATLLVDFSTTKDSPKIEEINVRYQRVSTYDERLNMFMAGYDVSKMIDRALHFLKKK